MKKIIFIFILSIIAIIFGIKISLEKNLFKGIKSLLSLEQKEIIKEYIFPYRVISQQKYKISQNHPIDKELDFKKSKKNIGILEDIELSNGKILKVFNLSGGFYSGIHEEFTSSGYIDFHKNNLLIMSSRGVLAFSKNINEDRYFKQIENNINKFIDLEQFHKKRWFSLKDLFVVNDKIYISFTEEIKKDCWNTSVIFGEMNYTLIEFKKLFSSNECVSSRQNTNIEFKGHKSEFNAHQSGGRIISLDDEHILLTLGDYRLRYLAQDKNSVNGKILKINIISKEYEIISMGHRNPQGLYYDRDNNFILETEHGPLGGDEINLIEVDMINNNNEILNYGWPIASAGEHYGGKTEHNKEKYEKYPLHNSHSQYGFIEPLKSFVPSIAISEVTKVGTDKYVVASMGRDRKGDKSLYFFELNNKKEIINLQQVKVFERIRDLKFNNGNLYLFMENTASIGVLNLN